MDTRAPLPAGEFSQWLRDMRTALSGRGGMDVACGSCRGCCTSSYYVKVRAHEAGARAAIGEQHLEPGPPGDPGSRLLGFRADGQCKMLVDRDCSIYPHRPETCRSYDCRVFAAAGMNAGENKTEINERVARWRFEFADEGARADQHAVAAAARYLRQHPVRFPNGHVPSRASEIAVLAVKAYAVFRDPPGNDADIRAALVKAVEDFDGQARSARHGPESP